MMYFGIVLKFDFTRPAFLHLTYALFDKGCHGCKRMTVGFTTTYAMSGYHHLSCEFESCS
jgi:hypothetical protein